jgi:GDP-mannose transporter
MLVSFALMVLSSGMASWSDFADILAATFGAADSALIADAKSPAGALSGFNIGYFWMIANCFSSAGYVGYSLMLVDLDTDYS